MYSMVHERSDEHNWADNRSGLSNRTGEQGKHGRGQPEDYRASAAARRCSTVQQFNRPSRSLLQENQALKEENRKLQSEIDAESMYPFRESVRWKKSEDGEDGPFCPICFAKEKMLMPLILRHRMTTPGVFSFECSQVHVPKGMGREPMYVIKESSLKQGRYTHPD